MLPRLFSDAEVNTIKFPVRCWESAHEHTVVEMAQLHGFLDYLTTCARDGFAGHKIVQPDVPTITWDNSTCTFDELPATTKHLQQRDSYANAPQWASFMLVSVSMSISFIIYTIVGHGHRLLAVVSRGWPITAFVPLALTTLATQALLSRWGHAQGQFHHGSTTTVLVTEATKLTLASTHWFHVRANARKGIHPRRVLMFGVPGFLHAFHDSGIFAVHSFVGSLAIESASSTLASIELALAVALSICGVTATMAYYLVANPR